MSGSNDNLKNMFDEAFAAEQIPFDMGAWNQMETLLNQKGAGIGFWVWFPGALIIGALGSWFAFSNTQGEMYNPRLASIEMETLGLLNSCNQIDALYNGSTEPTAFNIASLDPIDNDESTYKLADSQNATTSNKNGNSGAPNTSVTRASQATQETGPAIANSSKNTRTNGVLPIPNVVPNQTEPSTTGGLESTNSNPGIDDESSITDNTSNIQADSNDDSNLGDMVATDLEDPAEEVNEVRASMAFMPILPLSDRRANDPINAAPESEFASRNSFAPSFYIRGGVNKTFSGSLKQYPGIGQFVGIGYMRQLKPHLFLNGELNGALLRISDTAQIAGVQSYGFQQFENEYLVSTTEVIRLNASLLAHYRMKRLYLGAGIKPWMLGALKNSTDHLVGKEDLMVSYDESEGYFQWDRYRRFGASALIDAQYQITNDAFFGLRGAYGLTNNLNIDYRALRLLEIQAYLKLNIR